jgi:uncharacterized membrane protein YkvA (DUF1232 family)
MVLPIVRIMTAPIGSRLIAPFKGRAERTARSPERVQSLAGRAGDRLRRHSRALAPLRDELPALLRMAKAWARREYTAVPWRAVVGIVAGLLYFVSPLDAVPDFLPFLGFIDDAAVLGFILRSMEKDVGSFREWEEAKR